MSSDSDSDYKPSIDVDWKEALVNSINDRCAHKKEGLILPLSPAIGGAHHQISTNLTLSPEEITYHKNQGTLSKESENTGARVLFLWIFDMTSGTDSDPLPEIEARELSAVDNKYRWMEGVFYFKTADGKPDYLVPKGKLEMERRGHGLVTFSIEKPCFLDDFAFDGDLHEHLAGHRDESWDERLKSGLRKMRLANDDGERAGDDEGKADDDGGLCYD